MELSYPYLPRDAIEPDKITFGAAIGLAVLSLLVLAPLTVAAAALAVIAWRSIALPYKVVAFIPASVFACIWVYEVVVHGM